LKSGLIFLRDSRSGETIGAFERRKNEVKINGGIKARIVLCRVFFNTDTINPINVIPAKTYMSKLGIFCEK